MVRVRAGIRVGAETRVRAGIKVKTGIRVGARTRVKHKWDPNIGAQEKTQKVGERESLLPVRVSEKLLVSSVSPSQKFRQKQ